MAYFRQGLRGAALALGMVVATTGAQAETLAAALASAYNTSGLLKQNRALLRAADENVAQAVSRLRPVVEWTGSVNQQIIQNSTSASGFTQVTSKPATASIGLSASLLLYDFGASNVAIDIAKETVLSTRHSLTAVEQQILLRAVVAFFEVRRASEFLALRQNNVRLITQELRAARDRFEVGEVTRTDVSLAEARLAAAQSGLAAAEGALNRARVEYEAAVGHPPGDLVTPRGVPQFPNDVRAAMRLAARSHPSVLAAQKDVTVSKLNVKAAALALKPSVNLNSSYTMSKNLNDSGHNRSFTVGIGAGGPLYTSGRLSSLQRQAMAQRDAAMANLHVTTENVQTNAGNAYANILVARASATAGAQQIRAAQVAFRGVREEATLGARTTLDVLNAEQELLQARADLISAQYDEYISAYQLLSAIGQLTARHLRLNVQMFDPAAYYNLVRDAPSVVSERGRRLDRVLRKIGNN